MNKPAIHIIRHNLLAVLAAAVLLGLLAKVTNQASAFIFVIVYLGQALFNLVMGLAHIGRGPQDVGAAPYFLSMLLVLIIGFGACSGMFVLGGGFGGNMR